MESSIKFIFLNAHLLQLHNHALLVCTGSFDVQCTFWVLSAIMVFTQWQREQILSKKSWAGQAGLKQECDSEQAVMGKRPVSTLWQPRSRPASQISNTGLAPWLNRLCSDDIMTGQILQCTNDMYYGAGSIMQRQGRTAIFLASSTSASECRGRFRWLGGEVASRSGREGRGFDQWSTRHSRANPTQGISLLFPSTHLIYILYIQIYEEVHFSS